MHIVKFFLSLFLSIFFLIESKAQFSKTEYEALKKEIDKAEKLGGSGKYAEAIEIYKAMFALVQNTDSASLKAELLNDIGLMYDYSADYEQALNHYLNALKICEKYNLIKQKAHTYNNIGALFFLQSKYDDALSFFELSLKTEIIAENEQGKAQSYENIGIIHKKLSRFDKAESFYLDAFEIYKNLQDSVSIAGIFHNLGELFLIQKKYSKALEFFISAFEIEKKTKYLESQCYTLNSLSETYLAIKNYNKAEELCRQSLTLSENIKFIDQKKYSYELFSKIMEEKSDFSSALLYYKLFKQLNDSIFNTDKDQKFEELHVKYQTEKKENTIARQNAELANEKNKLLFVIILSFIFVGFSIALSIFHYRKMRAYKTLVQLNIEIAEKNLPLATKIKPIDSDNETFIAIRKQLSDLMETEKPYLKNNFSIDDLADALETNSKYISKIINDYCGSNFSTYINKRRIEYARTLLLNPDYDNLTLQAVAEMSGFGNRATFINAFKKYTGVTPSYFLTHKNEILL